MSASIEHARPPLRAAVAILVTLAGFVASCSTEDSPEITTMETADEPAVTQTATFGAGCFWCVEAVFERIDGVLDVSSGYTGGESENPTYEEVCSGDSGHVEVCRIRFDPAKVGYADLLEIFWQTHDPTTLNRQGNDVGAQYRSVVFYHDEEQRRLAETYLRRLDESGAFAAPIVTTIEKLGPYYPAEKYHQDYYRLNPNEGYCRIMIRPKIEKLRKVFADRLKD